MPVGLRRARTIFGLAKKRDRIHRYTWYRWGIGILATIAVALMPLTNTLRIDLWTGRSFWLGQEVGFVQGIKAFAFPFLGVNIAIILASRFLGRYLCGFGCPIGNLNRLAEWSRWTLRKGKWRWLGSVGLLFVCFVLAAITFSFWVDWRVFLEGSGSARLMAGAFLGGMTVIVFGIVRGWGMRFCKDYCPSGVYFALLGPNTFTGIEFAHPENCTDCHACENSCPVDLMPREMVGEVRKGIGMFPDGLTNFANCIRCGDCVAACESTTGEDDGTTPLRLGWLPPAARSTEKAESQAH